MIGIGRFAHARHGFCVISLCQGKINNKNFYAFVAVEPHNFKYFEKKYKKGENKDFKAFGEELVRGWGTKPSQDILDFVSRKYSVEFQVERSFLDRLLALVNHAAFSVPNTGSNTENISDFPLKPAKSVGF